MVIPEKENEIGLSGYIMLLATLVGSSKPSVWLEAHKHS